MLKIVYSRADQF